MASFMLPFGAFQIQLLEPAVIAAAKALQEAVTELNACMEAAFCTDTNDVDVQAKALDTVIEGSVLRNVEAASKEFNRCLETSEFPQVLPGITVQLVYASIVAQIFSLSFGIYDYDLVVSDGGRKYWWVTGRIMDKRGRVHECSGNSFMFDKEDERLTEGALLSACADCFIASVYAAVPYFPWDRQLPWAGEPRAR